MKKILVLALVLAAALMVCAPALAWPADGIPWWQPEQTFTAAGKAKAVDAAAGQVTVRVHLASRGVATYLEEDLTVTVTAQTQLLKARGDDFHAITLADVKTGDHARVVGLIDRSTPGHPKYVAKRVVMRTVVAPDQLKAFACRGPVVVVNAAGAQIGIHMNRVTRALWLELGGDLTCRVATDASIVKMVDGDPVVITLSDVATGDRVTAQGSVDRTDPLVPVYTVKWIRVLPAATL